MDIEFIEPAAIELDDAIEYYEIQLSGLGKKFFSDVLETLQLVSKFPQLFSKNSEHTRRAVLKKFPFNIIYTILYNKIFVIAIAHQNRAPEYWIERLEI